MIRLRVRMCLPVDSEEKKISIAKDVFTSHSFLHAHTHALTHTHTHTHFQSPQSNGGTGRGLSEHSAIKFTYTWHTTTVLRVAQCETVDSISTTTAATTFKKAWERKSLTNKFMKNYLFLQKAIAVFPWSTYKKAKSNFSKKVKRKRSEKLYFCVLPHLMCVLFNKN